MARARKLLDKTELEALGIGREVGYADPLTSRQFSGLYCMRPSGYRLHRKG